MNLDQKQSTTNLEETEKQEIEKKKRENEKSVFLQLGDIIQVTAPENDILNNQTFYIEFINKSKMVLVNTETTNSVTVKFPPETIKEIALLYRNEHPGYARQNDLLPGKWINIYFGGEYPTIITGEITNLEEDMIELKTSPDNEIIYINFDYSGIPEDLPIENIEIRSPPSKTLEEKSDRGIFERTPIIQADEDREIERERKIDQGVIQKQKSEIEEGEVKEIEKLGREESEIEEREDSEKVQQVENVKNYIQEFILQGNDIIFHPDEEFGPITQYIESTQEKQRYGIDTQANDMLDEMLSTIPNIERTNKVLNDIHTMIERFKQLRQQFSIFDEIGNISSAKVNQSNWKPLVNSLKKFNQSIYWLLPVVKNVKKVYNAKNDLETNDVNNSLLNENLMGIAGAMENYESNTFPEEQNKYIALYNELNPFLTPFDNVDPENMKDVIYETVVGDNITAIIDNLDNLYSSVVQSDVVKSRRFVIQKYNLGLNRLAASQITGSRMVAERIKLTLPDDISLKSMITLPEQVIRFSRINLPGTTILDKSNLNESFLNYWELLKKNTNVNTVLVPINDVEEIYADADVDEEFKKRKRDKKDNNDDDNEKIQKNTKEEDKEITNSARVNFNRITNYLPSSSSSVKRDTHKDIYETFLQKVIPKTRVLFRLFKKYISGPVTFIDAIRYLEPFLVYTDDLTYMQYVDVNRFLNEKISKYNKTFIERGRAFSLLKQQDDHNHNNRRMSSRRLYNTLSTQNQEQVFEKGYHTSDKLSVNETIENIMKIDSGRLYNTAVALESLPLMIPKDIGDMLQQEKENEKEKQGKNTNSNKCHSYTIAKQYKSLEELKSDNDRDIYFDKKYDTTKYSILEQYEKEMVQMNADEFIEFLVAKLQKSMKISAEEAIYMADTLISGNKQVKDGDYAFIFDLGNEAGRLTYYKRSNNRWEEDRTVDKSLFANDDTTLCNIQPDCVEVNDTCQSLEETREQIINNTIKTAINEFDAKYARSKEELERKIQQEFNYYNSIADKLSQMQINEVFKYNNKMILLGLKDAANAESAAKQQVSPFQSLLNRIMSQTDLVKKQNDIIRFAMTFTRSPLSKQIENEEETIHWRYCIKTQVPLLPAFQYTLACAFVNDYANYDKKVEELIKDIGKLSDDGDAWVDKHSGRIIKMIDLNTDEGYDESGFMQKTRDILPATPEPIVNMQQTAQEQKKKETPEIRACSNIISTLASNMGINIEPQRDFIIDMATSKFLSILPSEKKYAEDLAKAAKQNKKLPSYKELYNTTLLYLTMAVYLIAIQSSIPSIKTRRTFPGCIRSFQGYPFEGANGDMSSLNYLACVAYKVRSSIGPWSVLMKKKEGVIAEKIKASLESYFLEMDEIKRRFQEKAEYLITNASQEKGNGGKERENENENEHDLQRWTHFLPPLNSIKIRNLVNVTSEFKSKLLGDLKAGHRTQREGLLVVQSKIILFSLAIQECIQTVIDKKTPLLTSMINEPFLENACCNEKNTNSNVDSTYITIRYFVEEDPNILKYNDIVYNLSQVLTDIVALTKPFLFCSTLNSKNVYPAIIKEYNEETIYRAFIVYCKFNSILPISDQLSTICNEKPDFVLTTESVKESIQKLKKEGRNYTNSSLLRLLQIVNRENIVSFVVPSVLDSKEIMLRLLRGTIDEDDKYDYEFDSPNKEKYKSKEESSKKEKTSENTREKKRENIENEDDALYPALVNMLEECLDIETKMKMKSKSRKEEELNASLRKLRNHLARTNSEMKSEIIEFIQKNNNMTRSLRDTQLAALLDELMTWFHLEKEAKIEASLQEEVVRTKEDEEVDLREADKKMWNISDTDTYDFIQFTKNYLQYFGKTFPNILLNGVDYEKVKIQKYLGLSYTHEMDVKNIIKEYYSKLRNFYKNPYLNTLLSTVQTKLDRILSLADETRYYTPMKDSSSRDQSIFDKRTSILLVQHYFLLTLVEYIHLANEDAMLFDVDTDRIQTEDVLYTVENIEESGLYNTDVVNEDFENERTMMLQGNKKTLRMNVANLLLSYLHMMKDEKDLVNKPFEEIMDSVFKLKEKEKDTFTDRLKAKTDEERDVDTIMKVNKLGVWNKGLQKGLTSYVKETYDEEREFTEKILQAEKNIRKNPNVTDGNIDLYMEDYLEELDAQVQEEGEAYDMSFMNEDYDEGNFEADEVENYPDYD